MSTFTVEMPDGTLIEGIPEGTSKEDVMAKFKKMQSAPKPLVSRVVEGAKSIPGYVVEGLTPSPVVPLSEQAPVDPNAPFMDQVGSRVQGSISAMPSKPIVGPAVMGAGGAIVKGLGAVGEFVLPNLGFSKETTQSATQPFINTGNKILETAKGFNNPAAFAGQMAPYAALPIRGATAPLTTGAASYATTPDEEDRAVAGIIGGGLHATATGVPKAISNANSIRKDIGAARDVVKYGYGDSAFAPISKQIVDLAVQEGRITPRDAAKILPHGAESGTVLREGKKFQGAVENYLKQPAWMRVITPILEAGSLAGNMMGYPTPTALLSAGRLGIGAKKALGNLSPKGLTAVKPPDFMPSGTTMFQSKGGAVMGEVPAQPKTTSVDQLQEMLGQTTRATDAIPTLTERAPVAPRPVAQAAPEPTVAPVEPTAQPSPVAQAVPETIAPVEPTGTQLAATQFDEAIAKKIIDDPELQRYTKPYVIPKDIEPQVEKFLSPNGTKEVLAYGTPGSGKTTLRDEWLIRNPDGYTAEINVATTPGKIDLMKSDLETSPKSLVLVDEVDKIPKATVDKIKELRGTPGVQILYTTNDLGKVSESVLNTTKGSQISMSPKITPAQRETYALSLGRQYDLKSYGITPEEVVKRAGNASSFREIRNNVLEGVKIKETPMFSQFEVPSDIGLSSKFVTKLEDFQNNNTPQNIMIIDKSAFAKDPDLSGKLNTMFPLMQIDAGLTKALNSSSTMSPVHRVIISDAADAAAIASKKGLMERSNFTKTPTKLIIEDRYGNLDPAVKNRAIKIGSTDLD